MAVARLTVCQDSTHAVQLGYRVQRQGACLPREYSARVPATATPCTCLQAHMHAQPLQAASVHVGLAHMHAQLTA